MAEALAIASSGIAVAQLSSQVGGAVFKLKQLWDQVKDVPEDIADLMEQIDCLDPILWETENSFSQSGLPSIVWDELASKSMTMYCRKALQNLTHMVDELSHRINSSSKSRRKIAAVKVLLKKDLLKKLEGRLKNAVRMLTLAQQSYLVALTRVLPDIIVQRFAALTGQGNHAKDQTSQALDAEVKGYEKPNLPKTQPRMTGETMHLYLQRPRSKSVERGFFGRFVVESHNSHISVLYQAPMWLSRRSWELHSARACGALHMHLRSYSIIPDNSKTIAKSRSGSPKDMQQLFDTGLASPYDQTSRGNTLLHYAFMSRNFEMVDYFINIGLGPLNTHDSLWFTVAIAMSWSPSDLSFFKALLADRSFARKVLGFVENEDVAIKCCCLAGVSDFDIYMEFLPLQCPQHQATSLNSRLYSAQTAILSGGSIDVVRFILQPEWNDNPRDICTTNKMIFCAAFRLSQSIRDYWLRNIDRTNAWFQFAVDVIRHTPDVHSISSDPYLTELPWDQGSILTLNLFSTLRCAEYFTSFNKVVLLIHKTLVMWLGALWQAGVDLNMYGEREHQYLVDSKISREAKIVMTLKPQLRQCTTSVLRLVGLAYGPQPEDWKIFWNEPTDEFAGDFWQLIENPPLHIPGSWVDDDDYC